MCVCLCVCVCVCVWGYLCVCLPVCLCVFELLFRNSRTFYCIVSFLSFIVKHLSKAFTQQDRCFCCCFNHFIDIHSFDPLSLTNAIFRSTMITHFAANVQVLDKALSTLMMCGIFWRAGKKLKYLDHQVLIKVMPKVPRNHIAMMRDAPRRNELPEIIIVS